MSTARATKSKPPPSVKAPGGRSPTNTVDARGNVRIYADIPEEVSTELAVLALRRRMAKKDLLAEIITAAVKAG